MSGQLGIQLGTQTPEGVGMVVFNVELLGELSIDCFNDLADAIVELLEIGR